MEAWENFNATPLHVCECACGRTFDSHVQLVAGGRGWVLHTRLPCPGCGSHDGARRARDWGQGESETQTIDVEQVGSLDDMLPDFRDRQGGEAG